MIRGIAAVTLLVAGLAFAPAQAPRLGPYPSLGACPCSRSRRHRSPLARRPSPARRPGTRTSRTRPVAPDSAATIAYIDAHGGDFLHPDFGSPRAYGFPYAIVGAHQRRLPIHYTAYGEESDPGPFPVPLDAPVEGGNRSGGDRHVLVVDRSRCELYELYRGFARRGGSPHWNADSGAAWDLRSAARRPDSWTSADAAGLPIFPGLVHYDEVAAGQVDHAIRVTFDSTRNAWVHPASHCAGDTSDRRAPAMGTRLRLKPDYALGGFHGAARTIAVALKRFGLIVADNGSNWFFGGASDRRWDDANLDQLKRIPGRAFQVVRSRAHAHAC